MGKRPVLGLVGLCVGLTLSGCKDCDCGGWGWWGSRKEVGPAEAHVRRHSTSHSDGDVSTYRTRSVPSKSVAGKGVESAQVRPAHNYPDSYDPPAPQNGLNETAEQPMVDGGKIEAAESRKVLTNPDPVPAMTGRQPLTATMEKKSPPITEPNLELPQEPARQVGALPSAPRRELVPEPSKSEVTTPLQENTPAEPIATAPPAPRVDPPVPPPVTRAAPAPVSAPVPPPSTKAVSGKGTSESVIEVTAPPAPAPEGKEPIPAPSGLDTDTESPPPPPGPPSPSGK